MDRLFSVKNLILRPFGSEEKSFGLSKSSKTIGTPVHFYIDCTIALA